jgi:hypothetical protein
VDVLQERPWTCCGGRAEAPLTAREIAQALIADKATLATRKQAIDQPAGILSALRKRKGGMVFGEAPGSVEFGGAGYEGGN